MKIRTQHSSLPDWAKDHARNIDPVKAGEPSERALVDNGTVYDPERLPCRFVRSDDDAPYTEQTVREAPDGRLLHETRHRPLWSPEVFKKLAVRAITTPLAGGVMGAAIFPLFMLLIKMVRGGTVMWGRVFLPSFILGAIAITLFFTVPYLLGRSAYQIAQHGFLPDQQDVVDDVNDLPGWARTLEALKEIKGWGDDEVQAAKTTSRSFGITTLKTVLYRAPDDQWLLGYWLEGTIEDPSKSVELLSSAELKSKLLDHEELELYQEVFGELPRPGDSKN